MSNMVRFLETLGSNPALTKLSAAEFEAMVANLDVDDAQRQALVARDGAALNDMLGGRERMLCVIWPADEPVRENDQPGDDEPAEDTPPETE
jgi:hypothetical protein